MKQPNIFLPASFEEEDRFLRANAENRIDLARDAAILAIDEYYNGDRAWAEKWLLAAYEAGKDLR